MDDVLELAPRRHVAERVSIVGDKSISHRVVLLAAMAHGSTVVERLNRGADVEASLAAVRTLGARISETGDRIVIEGSGSFASPPRPLDCANSGTTMRLLAGMLAGRCDATLIGDASLTRRPMERVAQPLRRMGADVRTTDGRAPLLLTGGATLRGIEHLDERNSAQVQSALLMAGLRAVGPTTAATLLPVRDHTQRMLQAMGAQVARDANAITVMPGSLRALDAYVVPGDVSAACYFFLAAAAADRSICAVDVGVNPTRAGALQVMREMGLIVRLERERELHAETSADVTVGGRPSRGCDVPPDLVPNLIDEIPVLCALGALAPGTFRVRGAAELRVKESDRIAATARLLHAFGAGVEEHDDGITVHGGRALRAPARVDTEGDHRIGMTAAALATGLGQPIVIAGAACIATSVPEFAAAWEAAFGA